MQQCSKKQKELPMGKMWFLLLGLSLIQSVEAGMSCCKNAAGLGPMQPDPYAVKPAGWDEDDDGKWEPDLVAVTSLRGSFRFWYEVKTVALDSAPWLLAGLILAGVVKALQPSDAAVARVLGGRGSFGGSVCGAAAGLLLPCCSCGVMPVAAGVVDQGASAAAAIAMTFVASGSGLDSFFYYAGLAGPKVACWRMASVALLGVISSIAAVAAASKSVSNSASSHNNSRNANEFNVASSGASCCAPSASTASENKGSCCDGNEKKPGASPGATGVVLRFSTAVLAGFNEVVPWVAVGVCATAAAAASAPPSGTWGLLGNAGSHSSSSSHSGAGAAGSGADALSRLVLFAAALPVQMCEHAIVHVAAGAHHNLGASPGTAFGLLCFAPATSLGWLALIASKLGTRAAVAAAAAACLGALVLSLALDALEVPSHVLVPSAGVGEAAGPAGILPAWFIDVAPIALSGLAARALYLRGFDFVFSQSAKSTSNPAGIRKKEA